MADSDAGRVAVVGMAVRVPGADDDLDRFWDLLAGGVDSVSHFDREQLVDWGVAPELVDRPNLVPARAVLADQYRFDAALFGYSPDESALIDPQQRLLLMCAWAALEHAGYPPVAADGNSTGVFVGTGMNVYLLDNVLKHRTAIADAAGLLLVIGNDKDFAATRIAYKLNLQGPALTVQTACSTSLVAVHTGRAEPADPRDRHGAGRRGHRRAAVPPGPPVPAGRHLLRGRAVPLLRRLGRWDRAGRRRRRGGAQAAATTLGATATPCTRSSPARRSTTTAPARPGSPHRGRPARPRRSPPRWRWPVSHPDTVGSGRDPRHGYRAGRPGRGRRACARCSTPAPAGGAARSPRSSRTSGTRTPPPGWWA